MSCSANQKPGNITGSTSKSAETFSPFVSPPPMTSENVTVEQAKALITKNKDNPNFVILDVRTPDEFKSGHLADAINIDFYGADFKTYLDQLDKNKTYLVYCRTGVRSTNSVNIMLSMKFTRLYNMTGGITAWTGAKLPVVN